MMVLSDLSLQKIWSGLLAVKQRQPENSPESFRTGGKNFLNSVNTLLEWQKRVYISLTFAPILIPTKKAGFLPNVYVTSHI